MKYILIMGGTSFVSSSLAKYLIKKGYIVDILTRGLKPLNYDGFREHIICNRNSITDMKRSLNGRKYELIFDISAYTKNDVDILLSSINIGELQKYIFCSSGAVYKPSNTFVNESFEKGENLNWGKYGEDKKEAEDFIIYSKIPYVIFRPTYIYGENNNLYREAFFFDRIRENKVIPVPYGEGTVTQFIHIDDLVKIFESAALSNNKCKIYNVTDPEVISWEEFIITCGEVIGIKPKIKKIYKEKVSLETRSYFPFRDVTYLLSIESLINDKIYNPSISLREGLKKTYKWYIKYKPILRDVRMNMVEELAKK
jgi:nucleoside-diphosphate-sugar epimerase